MGRQDNDITRWSNAKKARYFAHVIAHLTMSRGGEVRIPLTELQEMTVGLGMVVDDGNLVFAVDDGKLAPKHDFVPKPITHDRLVGYDKQGQLVMARLIDRGESYEIRHTEDLRGKKCAICRHGWAPTSESWHDQFHLRVGGGIGWADQADPGIGETVHLSCFIRTEALNERSSYSTWVAGARVRYELSLLENGYWRGDDPWAQKPWYRFRLLDHDAMISIGRRKRVASIQVHPTEDGADFDWWEAARDALKDEDVTKEFGPRGVLIHAWTREKGAEYVKTLVDVSGYAARPTQEEE